MMLKGQIQVDFLRSRRFVASDGSLCSNVKGDGCRIIRPIYRLHFQTLENTHQLRAVLRAGEHTSLGCYRLAFVCWDGGELCFKCVRKEYRQVSEAMRDKAFRNSGFGVLGLIGEHDTDGPVFCDHCNECLWGEDIFESEEV